MRLDARPDAGRLGRKARPDAGTARNKGALLANLDAITYEVQDDVAVITLNRPASANSMSMKLTRELYDVALAVDNDEAARAVLITAKGGIFRAGGDLTDFCTEETGVESLKITRAANHLHYGPGT